jgi:hypothetical protein
MVEKEKPSENERFHSWTQHVYQRFTATVAGDGVEATAGESFRDFLMTVFPDPGGGPLTKDAEAEPALPSLD